MMVRSQIQFTSEQHRLLRVAAQRDGVSIAELVRRCVIHYFEAEAPNRQDLYERATALIGTFQDPDGATDLSERHDEFLDGAFR